MPLYIFWLIWKARNDIVVEDEMVFIQNAKSFFFCKSSLTGDQNFYSEWFHDLCSFH